MNKANRAAAGRLIQSLFKNRQQWVDREYFRGTVKSSLRCGLTQADIAEVCGADEIIVHGWIDGIAAPAVSLREVFTDRIIGLLRRRTKSPK